MITKKVILRTAAYDYDMLRPLVFSLLDTFIGDKIKKKNLVVIKPNLLAPALPEKGMLTHPLIVRATVEYVLQKGARPLVSDSPAMGTLERVLKESGIREALRGLSVECREFKRSVPVDIGPPFHKIEIAEEAMNADLIVNLPKLKTHAQMLLTLGVKNLFGCVVGLKKPEWHFRTGVDREMFARLLVKIYTVVNPAANLLDGILAMEGQGPGKSGTPRHLGILMASDDAVAMDVTVCRMLGVAPDSMPTNRIAVEMGLPGPDILIDGQLPVVRDFKMPVITPLVFGPKRLHGFMRRHLVQRPTCDHALCRLCGECWKYCPANAMRVKKHILVFDYNACIRCYCCIEICPHGALRATETIPGRVARRILLQHKR